MPKGNPIEAGYVTVAERIEKFYEKYSEGRIITNIIEHDSERGFILMRAEIYRNTDDSLPASTGHAFELRTEGYVNKTSYIENCETSAVGRAIAMLGFEIKRGIASQEEMDKATRHEKAIHREIDEQAQLIQDLRIELNKMGVFQTGQDAKEHLKTFTNQRTDNIYELNTQEKQDYIAALKILIKKNKKD